MVYIINNYNGSQLVGINDKTVNNTATSLRLPGRDYKPYGEVVVENLVWMLQHFNGATPPLNPIQGQVWYDSSNQELKVWNGGSWINTGKTITGTQFPPVAQVGQLFYNLSKKQLFVYDNTATWQLLSPMGASDLSDPAPGAEISFTDTQVFKVADENGTDHSIIRMSVQGNVIAVWSGESFITISGAIPGFTPTVIRAGLNMEPGFVLQGVVAQATTATNSLNLGGIPAASWMRLDQSNTPLNTNVSLGSSGLPFKDIYATNIYGLSSTATSASNASQLGGQLPAYYLNASNVSTGTLNVARLPYTPVNKAGDTMTGTLTLNADPSAALHAATKQYVDNLVFSYGRLQTTYPTNNYFDVFPPVGKVMSNLIAFIPSIAYIYFDGTVDNNDTLTCDWAILSDRVRVTILNTEQRLPPSAHFLAIWK